MLALNQTCKAMTNCCADYDMARGIKVLQQQWVKDFAFTGGQGVCGTV